MEILFKDNDYLFIIRKDELIISDIKYYYSYDITNVTNIEDVVALYHYRGVLGKYFPVYFEHNDVFITKIGGRFILQNVNIGYTKVYTIKNLNLL